MNQPSTDSSRTTISLEQALTIIADRQNGRVIFGGISRPPEVTMNILRRDEVVDQRLDEVRQQLCAIDASLDIGLPEASQPSQFPTANAPVDRLLSSVDGWHAYSFLASQTIDHS